MMKFDTYRLLTESLGMYNLGVRPVQSLGIQSNRPGLGESGFPPELSAKKGKSKPPFGGGEDGPPGVGGEESPPFDDEMGPPEDDMGSDGPEGNNDLGGSLGGGSVEDRIAELESELAALKAEIGADDKDADLDHEDDLGGDLDGGEENGIDSLDGEEGGDGSNPFAKGGEEGSEEDGDEEDENPFAKKDKKFIRKMKSGEEKESGPSFLMKKKCNADNEKVVLGKAKKCDDSMGSGGGALPMKKCKNCTSKIKKKIQKETTGYERPATHDNSETAWLQSIHNQLASTDVRKKHSDGMRKFTNEDLLLPPPGGGLESVPEAKTRNPDDLGYTAEAVHDILSRLARLEKRQ